MNILLISHFFPPHKGGVETAAYNTAKYLAKLGHNVTIITSKVPKGQDKHFQTDQFQGYRFKSINLPELKGLPQISSFGIMPRAILKLPKIIRKNKIQVIHVEGRLFPISIISAVLNKIIFKRPFIVSVQGRLQIGLTGIIEDIFDKTISAKLYQKVGRIICVSQSLKNRLQLFKINKDLIEVIPNGVDTSLFNKKNATDSINKLRYKKEGYKNIAYIGRLDPQKGVKYLIRAIPEVLKKFEKVHFHILGNGKLEYILKNEAKKLKITSNVTFIKMIELEEMPYFYSEMDIFCLPSIHEGFPLSIAEALSMELIVVASETEGIPEAITENVNGFLVEPKNVSQLSEKLIKALCLNYDQIKSIQKNNRNLAEKKYSWEVIVKRIIRTYIITSIK